jgi:hypothetical protein
MNITVTDNGLSDDAVVLAVLGDRVSWGGSVAFSLRSIDGSWGTDGFVAGSTGYSRAFCEGPGSYNYIVIVRTDDGREIPFGGNVSTTFNS